MTSSSASNESVWAERVRSWRSSGETGMAFARAHGFTHSALRYWATRLARERRVVQPAMVRLVPRSVGAATQSAELVVEIGASRIRVSRGFDPEMLTAVARALGGVGQ